MAKFQTFKDLNITFKPHPVTGDLIVKKDDAAVKQAIVNLLMTSRGERPFQPNLGSDLRRILFNPLDASTAAQIGENIRETLDTYEPRISILQLDVDTNFDDDYAHLYHHCNSPGSLGFSKLWELRHSSN